MASQKVNWLFLLAICFFLNSCSESTSFHSLYLSTKDEWKASRREFVVNQDGTILPEGAAPARYLHGMVDSAQQASRNAGAITFAVNYLTQGKLRFFIETVSAGAELQVLIDGRPALKRDLPVGAGQGPWKESRYLEQYNLYQCLYNEEIAVAIPQGEHKISIENLGADWLSINYFVFENYTGQIVSASFEQWQELETQSGSLLQRLDSYQKQWQKYQHEKKPAAELRNMADMYLRFLQQAAAEVKHYDQRLFELEQNLIALLKESEQGRNFVEKKRGYLKRVYLSPVDSSLQPYDVMIPLRYDSAKAYSLIIDLHGYMEQIKPWHNFLWAQVDSSLDSLKLIRAAVYGRRNRYYLGAGEQDVLEVLADIRRNYSIDTNRVYLAGASMGGYGTWQISLRYPDKFAAISPLCGITTSVQTSYGHYPRSNQEILAASFSPLLLAENARYLPAKIYHGAKDPVIPADQSRQMVNRLIKLGYEHQYHECPQLEHNVWDTASADPTRKPFLLSKIRNPFPAQVRHKTFYFRTGKSYWLDIQGKENWNDFAEITGKWTAADHLTITTDNVSAFAIDLRHPQYQSGQSLELTINQQRLILPPSQAKAWLAFHKNRVWQAGSRTSKELLKRKGLEGPWLDGECSPFIVVYGTQQGFSENSEPVQALRTYYAQYNMQPRFVADTLALSNHFEKNFNLVLIGNPAQNSYTAQLFDDQKSALRFTLHALRGRQHFSGNSDHGLRLIYPNPRNPEKYVLLDWYPAGITDFQQLNQMMIADYLIYRLDKREFKVSDSGFFDSRWELD